MVPFSGVTDTRFRLLVTSPRNFKALLALGGGVRVTLQGFYDVNEFLDTKLGQMLYILSNICFLSLP